MTHLAAASTKVGWAVAADVSVRRLSREGVRAIRLGVISCEIMRQEIERVIADDPTLGIAHVEFVEFGLHVEPERLRRSVAERVAALNGRVDAVLLGYGRCQALDGLGAHVALPVVLPEAEDCIALLLGPDEYAAQVAKCAGTWFMTPGWCRMGIDGLMHSLGIDARRCVKKTPLEVCMRLFRGYKRVLLVDTGVGDPAEHRRQAQDFADVLGLAVEAVPGDLGPLRRSLAKAATLARMRIS